MKMTLKGFVGLLILLGGTLAPAMAGQQLFLSTSPNSKYRVIVEQVIDRRVGDHIFFRYPISVVTPKTHRSFEMKEGSTPLIQETDRGTFQIHWDSIHFDWAKDSQKFFCNIEVIEGIWKTYFVDISARKAIDLTPDLEKTLVKRVDSHDWDCQQPKVELVKWTKPYLAFLKVTSICGEDRTKENKKLFYDIHSILYDTKQEKIVYECSNCKDDSSLKKFDRYFQSTMVTPTPTPEETPTAQ